jgi:hypothetical protein
MTDTPVPNPTDLPVLPTPPLAVRGAIILTSAALVLLFAWGLYASVFAAGSIVWFAVGFSVVGLFAAGFGVALGLGQYVRGPGMAGLCVAGAVLTCGVFGWLDLRPNLASVPELASLLRPWLIAVGAGAAGIAALSGVLVLARRPSAWRRFIAGGITFVVLGAGLAAIRGPGARLLETWEGAGEAIRVSLLLVFAFLAVALISAGGHLCIRAFEITREPGRDADDAELDATNPAATG